MRFIAFVLTTALTAQAQIPVLSPNAPVDKPTSGDWQAFTRETEPYVAKARAAYPEAKARFAKGLPKGSVFFLTFRLHDPGESRFEQVFIYVQKIEDGKVMGNIASDLGLLKSYKTGQLVLIDETELVDWTISKPDGSEEGNFVGKYLDSKQPAPSPH